MFPNPLLNPRLRPRPCRPHLLPPPLYSPSLGQPSILTNNLVLSNSNLLRRRAPPSHSRPPIPSRCTTSLTLTHMPDTIILMSMPTCTVQMPLPRQPIKRYKEEQKKLSSLALPRLLPECLFLAFIIIYVKIIYCSNYLLDWEMPKNILLYHGSTSILYSLPVSFGHACCSCLSKPGIASGRKSTSAWFVRGWVTLLAENDHCFVICSNRGVFIDTAPKSSPSFSPSNS